MLCKIQHLVFHGILVWIVFVYFLNVSATVIILDLTDLIVLLSDIDYIDLFFCAVFLIFWYVKIILCTAHKIICADIDRVLLKWQKWLAIVFLASARMNNKQLSNVLPCMPSFFSIFIHGFMISWHFLYHFQVLLQIVLVKKVWNIVNIFAQLIIWLGKWKSELLAW